MLSLDEQLAIFDRNARGASYALIGHLSGLSKIDLVLHARQRLADGYMQYGDSICHQDRPLRDIEILDELADALNRLAMNPSPDG